MQKVEQLKEEGNRFYKTQKYVESKNFYQQVIFSFIFIFPLLRIYYLGFGCFRFHNR